MGGLFPARSEGKMAHWNHRVVKQKLEDGTEWFSVREVFYNDDGSIFAYTEEPVDISSESIEELKQYTQWILDCLDKDILVDGEVTFIDPELLDHGRRGSREKLLSILSKFSDAEPAEFDRLPEGG